MQFALLIYESPEAFAHGATTEPILYTGAYARGTENVVNTYNYLDLVPKGRDEDDLPFTMSWVRHHDRYADG
jgi:predicted dithiol-disulfide oxidoreductase (DUF899 family)